jgi:DNA gyrase subunit B
MTYADVDGSHIRTLILTFFFRYLKSIIDFGYLYIAQPPLYKVKIGKHDKYLQNDNELMNFIFTWAKDEIEIILDGKSLQKNEIVNLLENIEKIYLKLNEVSEKEGIQINSLEKKYINDEYSFGDKELDSIKNNFNWKNAVFLYKKKVVSDMFHFSFLDFSELLKIIAKPYMNIQRYKGLGEMNPEQLWETAMDPKKRQLLKVTISDAEKADHWFNLLMGDDAAPRKTFIEERAHFVKNLDI